MANRAPRKTARGGSPDATAQPPQDPAPHGADLLKAIAGQNPLWQALLGLDAARRRQQQDMLRLPTFEDLFEERVARALDRLGTTRAIDELRAELATIDRRLREIERKLDARPRRTKS